MSVLLPNNTKLSVDLSRLWKASQNKAPPRLVDVTHISRAVLEKLTQLPLPLSVQAHLLLGAIRIYIRLITILKRDIAKVSDGLTSSLLQESSQSESGRSGRPDREGQQTARRRRATSAAASGQGEGEGGDGLPSGTTTRAGRVVRRPHNMTGSSLVADSDDDSHGDDDDDDDSDTHPSNQSSSIGPETDLNSTSTEALLALASQRERSRDAILQDLTALLTSNPLHMPGIHESSTTSMSTSISTSARSTEESLSGPNVDPDSSLAAPGDGNDHLQTSVYSYQPTISPADINTLLYDTVFDHLHQQFADSSDLSSLMDSLAEFPDLSFPSHHAMTPGIVTVRDAGLVTGGGAVAQHDDSGTDGDDLLNGSGFQTITKDQAIGMDDLSLLNASNSFDLSSLSDLGFIHEDPSLDEPSTRTMSDTIHEEHPEHPEMTFQSSANIDDHFSLRPLFYQSGIDGVADDALAMLNDELSRGGDPDFDSSRSSADGTAESPESTSTAAAAVPPSRGATTRRRVQPAQRRPNTRHVKVFKTNQRDPATTRIVQLSSTSPQSSSFSHPFGNRSIPSLDPNTQGAPQDAPHDAAIPYPMNNSMTGSYSNTSLDFGQVTVRDAGLSASSMAFGHGHPQLDLSYQADALQQTILSLGGKCQQTSNNLSFHLGNSFLMNASLQTSFTAASTAAPAGAKDITNITNPSMAMNNIMQSTMIIPRRPRQYDVRGDSKHADAVDIEINMDYSDHATPSYPTTGPASTTIPEPATTTSTAQIATYQDAYHYNKRKRASLQDRWMKAAEAGLTKQQTQPHSHNLSSLAGYYEDESSFPSHLQQQHHRPQSKPSMHDHDSDDGFHTPTGSPFHNTSGMDGFDQWSPISHAHDLRDESKQDQSFMIYDSSLADHYDGLYADTPALAPFEELGTVAEEISLEVDDPNEDYEGKDDTDNITISPTDSLSSITESQAEEAGILAREKTIAVSSEDQHEILTLIQHMTHKYPDGQITVQLLLSEKYNELYERSIADIDQQYLAFQEQLENYTPSDSNVLPLDADSYKTELLARYKSQLRQAQHARIMRIITESFFVILSMHNHRTIHLQQSSPYSNIHLTVPTVTSGDSRIS